MKSSLHEQKSDKLLFHFEYTQEAALHNTIVLQHCNFNMNLAIQAQKSSQVYYGSEFNPPDTLAKILENHPLWKYTKSILSTGASFPLHPIPNKIRKNDIKYHKERGNNKSATKAPDVISKMIQEDVECGFALRLPLGVLDHIPNASLAQLGCQEQSTIETTGTRIPKFRLTHDQSFLGPSGSSVNSRVVSTKLTPIMYGFCLKRVIHYILGLRHRIIIPK
jgi:hypothetical protein